MAILLVEDVGEERERELLVVGSFFADRLVTVASPAFSVWLFHNLYKAHQILRQPRAVGTSLGYGCKQLRRFENILFGSIMSFT